MLLKQQIATRIRELRIAKGLTQEQLADKADINQFHLSKIEREKEVNLTLDLLDKIIHSLGVSYDEFFSFEGSTDITKQLIYQLSLNENKDDLLNNFIDIARITQKSKES